MQIGKGGASKALLSELDRALETHELLKVRTLKECPQELPEVLTLVESSLGAVAVGAVGRVAILYRARSKDPTIELPGGAKLASHATKGSAAPRIASRKTP